MAGRASGILGRRAFKWYPNIDYLLRGSYMSIVRILIMMIASVLGAWIGYSLLHLSLTGSSVFGAIVGGVVMGFLHVRLGKNVVRQVAKY